MKKTNTRVRRDSSKETAIPQAQNMPDTFVVTVTSKIKSSAKEAGETVAEFMNTAIRQKLEVNASPLHLLLRADEHSIRDLYVDQDGRLFRWTGCYDNEPLQVSLEGAVDFWRLSAKKARYFEDRHYKHGSTAETLIQILLHHWRTVGVAVEASRRV